MKVGIVGLGRMGAGISDRLQSAGHEVVGFDRNPAVSSVDSLLQLTAELSTLPRIVWVMVPAGEPTEAVITDLAGLLSSGDVVIDGGNSYYRDSIRRGHELAVRGIHFLDVGTSGGIWGLREGFCLMVGGEMDAVKIVQPVLLALAAPGGLAHVGPTGAGHFVKMVHNGIEYGLLEAYAEGFDLLAASHFDLDLRQVAGLWNNGSVVRSWLLELAERALRNDPQIAELRGYVEDSGEGRWTVNEAVELGVPVTVIAEALFRRFASRTEDSLAMRFIAALRREFGGHAVREHD
jgi:6-phosphogluconate dehydrogenase